MQTSKFIKLEKEQLKKLEKLLPEIRKLEHAIKKELDEKPFYEKIVKDTECLKVMVPAGVLVLASAGLFIVEKMGGWQVPWFEGEIPPVLIPGFALAVMGMMGAMANGYSKQPIEILSDALVPSQALLTKLHKMHELKTINVKTPIDVFLSELSRLRYRIKDKRESVMQEENRLAQLQKDLLALNLFRPRSAEGPPMMTEPHDVSTPHKGA